MPYFLIILQIFYFKNFQNIRIITVFFLINSIANAQKPADFSKIIIDSSFANCYFEDSNVLENQEMKFIDKNISGILKKKSRCAGIKFADTGSLVNIYKYKNLQPRKWYFNNNIYTGFSMCLYHSLKKKTTR